MNSPEKDPPSVEALHDMVSKVANDLREFCDSVVIVVTLVEGQDTHSSACHKGNAYACDASVQAWLKRRLEGKDKSDE